ncbi:MAG: YbhB/YbcL family Raf kinase inhibitor-like protein [Aeromonadaceae bacterium]|nr:YbhB/YbcL family Raf kinase inhibitor-like protein [Aeromonadaceae bacterium]
MKLLAPLTLLGASLLANPALAAFSLTSPGLPEGASLPLAQVYNGFGCQGGNQSPALQWQEVPAGTRSLALTVYDPDAPTGSGWWHWVVFNLPADSTGLPASIAAEGQGLPAGAVQSLTDFGQPGFGGACPPEGDPPHRYRFTLHALKVDKLDLPATSMPALVGFMLHANELAQTSLTLHYGR